MELIHQPDVEDKHFHVGTQHEIGCVLFWVQHNNKGQVVAINQGEGLTVTCKRKCPENQTFPDPGWYWVCIVQDC